MEGWRWRGRWRMETNHIVLLTHLRRPPPTQTPEPPFKTPAPVAPHHSTPLHTPHLGRRKIDLNSKPGGSFNLRRRRRRLTKVYIIQKYLIPHRARGVRRTTTTSCKTCVDFKKGGGVSNNSFSLSPTFRFSRSLDLELSNSIWNSRTLERESGYGDNISPVKPRSFHISFHFFNLPGINL